MPSSTEVSQRLDITEPASSPAIIVLSLIWNDLIYMFSIGERSPAPPPPSPAAFFSRWEGATFLLDFWKRKGGRKKLSTWRWGGLKEFLPQVFAWGELTMFLVYKGLCKIKNGFESSVSKVDLSLCVNQTTIWCLVCDISVLLNHLNNITRN